MMNRYFGLSVILLALVLASCTKTPQLPILGPKSVNTAGDTVYFTIPSFRFTNQDGGKTTNEDLAGNIYVAEFFFTSCPSICPVMGEELHRVHDRFVDQKDIKIVSFTLDPEYDTPERLKDHAQRRDIDLKRWIFLNASRRETYEIAQKGFFITAIEDKSQPGGIVHSGKVALVDRKGRVRGYYDATREEEINLLINDISLLKDEK